MKYNIAKVEDVDKVPEEYHSAFLKDLVSIMLGHYKDIDFEVTLPAVAIKHDDKLIVMKKPVLTKF